MSGHSNNSFNNLLGIEYVACEEGRCVVALTVRPELCNSIDGMVHGGVTSTLADVAMGHGAAEHIDGVQQCVTVESQIHYLASARCERLIAEAIPLRVGGRLITMEARVRSESGELIAFACGTYARRGGWKEADGSGKQ